MYRSLRVLTRGGLKLFYRTIEITGAEHVRGATPTILASNHPNSIVDPLILGIFESRQVSFCARDGLFRIPGFGWLLRQAGAIPIARRSDHGGGRVDNADAFAACREVLRAGGVLSIFPEGKTHDRLHIHRLKTGTARIALDAESGADPVGVRIVPVALNYLVRQAFRSDVHIAFGEPIEVRPRTDAQDDADPQLEVRALTERIGSSLRELAVHVEEAEDERIIAQVTAIMVKIRRDAGLDPGGQSPAERVALAQRVVDAYRWYRTIEPEHTAALRRRLSRYLHERERLGLGGETPALQHRCEQLGPFRGGARTLAFLVLGFPFALLGLTAALPPYLLMRAAVAILRLRTDRLALAKGLTGLVLFGSFFGGMTALVAWLFGPLWAVLYGISLPPAAVFALRWATELRLHRVSVRSLVNYVRHRDRLAWLREEREALTGELAELRTRYLAMVEAADRAESPSPAEA